MGGIFSSSSSDEEIRNALQAPNRLVVDSRSVSEFRHGDGFSGAINIPVDSIESQISQLGTDKERYIITYCAAGVRAARAAGVIRSHGFLNVLSTTNANHLREIAEENVPSSGN